MTKDVGRVPDGTGLSQAEPVSRLGPSGFDPSRKLACHDCGAPYDDPAWVEAVAPHDVWNQHLSPTGDEGGILCIGCMARRAVVAGLSEVPIKITAGPLRLCGSNEATDWLRRLAAKARLNGKRREAQAIHAAAVCIEQGAHCDTDGSPKGGNREDGCHREATTAGAEGIAQKEQSND